MIKIKNDFFLKIRLHRHLLTGIEIGCLFLQTRWQYKVQKVKKKLKKCESNKNRINGKNKIVCGKDLFIQKWSK